MHEKRENEKREEKMAQQYQTHNFSFAEEIMFKLLH
jgi:hypothetical protein